MAEKAKSPLIEQPSIEEQEEYNSIVENDYDEVAVRGRKWKIYWLRNAAKRKVTSILLNKKIDELSVSSRCVAAMRLNGYWSIKFFYWFLWRWYYYFKQYTDNELLGVIALCKKKAEPFAYYANITFLTEVKDSMMAMTRDEVERIQVALRSEQRAASQKSTQNSQPRSSSSEV